MTLGGLLKHLSVVEAGWLNLTFAGGVARPSWLAETDPENASWSFTTAAGAEPEQLFAWFEESVAVPDGVVAAALAIPDGLSAVSEEQDNVERWVPVVRRVAPSERFCPSW